MQLTSSERRATRARLRDGVVRRLSLRARAEIALVCCALVLLAIGNGELAAARTQLLEERRLAAESSARIERIVDEIQGTIIEILTPASPAERPTP